MTKRILALLLSLVFCLGLLPVGASAEQPAVPAGQEEAQPSWAEPAPAAEEHWYDEAGGWEDEEEGEGFQPYAFTLNADRTVSAGVRLAQSAQSDGEEVTAADAIADPIEAEEFNVQLLNATCATDGSAAYVSVRLLVPNINDVVCFFLYELTENQQEKIETLQDSNGVTHYVKAESPVQITNATSVQLVGNGEAVVTLNAALKLFGNTPTPVGTQTTIAVAVSKVVDGQVEKSDPVLRQLTVEGVEAIVSAPFLANATVVSDGKNVSARVRLRVEDTTDLAAIEIVELTDQAQGALTTMEDADGRVRYVKAIGDTDFYNVTMVRGYDNGVYTIVADASLKYFDNTPPAAGEQTTVAVRYVNREGGGYKPSPLSNGVTTGVWPAELSQEQLQAFIPANLRITAENATYTLDVTVMWDVPANADMVDFYEVENGLLNQNGSQMTVYPFDGAVQSTIIQGDGTAPYEYQTINATNILRFSIRKKLENMKQIDEELGVALCVQEGDTIQTTLFACVGELGQETEARSVTYRFGAAPTGGVELILPASLNTIGKQAFANSGFSSVSVPAAVRTIEQLAFAGCGNLTDVYFYTDQVEIADDAFPTGNAIVFHCHPGSDPALFAQRKGFATEYLS